MYLVIVIAGDLQKGDLEEKTFEAATYAEAQACQEYWDKQRSTLYAEVQTANEALPTMGEALLGA